MEILNLGGTAEGKAQAPKSRKKMRVILGIGALAAVTGIGSTLAANISLNGGGNVEFGQGVATTAACDDSITLTPVSEFSNTEEDAAFAMTAIQISNLDITPEGWDSDSEDWINGFDRETHTWIDTMKEHAGQYISGYNGSDPIWTNTCENKVLMLRAYTDNFPERTVENNVASPLYLNGWDSIRPLYNTAGANAGMGIRIRHDEGSADWDYTITDVFTDGNYLTSWQTFDINWGYFGNFGDDCSVTIGINRHDFRPPLESSWVDKLTIESATTQPNNWNDFLNWFD
jgi:hypothetical protein